MQQPPDDTDITALLADWRKGDEKARDALMRAIYPVLRDIARARLRAAPGDPSLRATELVSEAYAKLARVDNIEWQSRVHFFAVAARAIRNFIIDYLRARESAKRGRDVAFVPLDEAHDAAYDGLIDLRIDWLAVHAALNDLERIDAPCATIVELKFFSGLTTEEIAEAQSVSVATVVRQWRFARAWLEDRLRALR